MPRLLSCSFRIVLISAAFLAITGCSRYSSNWSATVNVLEGYGRHVRWDQGFIAVREDILAFAEAVPLDNMISGYLGSEGVDGCVAVERFLITSHKEIAVQMFLPKKMFCGRGDLGIELSFEKGTGNQIVLNAVDFVPSYFSLPAPEQEALESQAWSVLSFDEKHVWARPENSHAGTVKRREIDKKVAAIPYDIAVMKALERFIGVQCHEDKAFPAKLPYFSKLLIRFECEGNGYRASFTVDRFGRAAEGMSLWWKQNSLLYSAGGVYRVSKKGGENE